jgi:hypothetical protein
MSSTSNKPTRAAIYPRVSTTEQDTGMQVAELRQVCGQRGWNIVAEHLDDGVSGVATARAGLDALLADVQAGKLEGWPGGLRPPPRVRSSEHGVSQSC